MRYLKGSITYGLQLYKYIYLRFSTFSNANWAGYSDDKKSTSALCIFYDDNLVTWHIGKQKVMPRSNIELYYRALASVASELLWIKSLLDDIGFFV